jgi:hypothetical protein
MWIIKDKDLKEVVNKFFKDSEIEASFLCSEKDRITLFRVCPNKYNVTFTIGKDQFISVYDPNNWNGYPTVIPPESNNPWLVQHKDGSILIANFSKGLYPCWFSNDSPVSYVLHDIVAFRKLPEPYK